MIQHFFKLIWNRKKTNFMTSLGIFISFIVLFLVITTIVYNIGNYLKPLGFEYKECFVRNHGLAGFTPGRKGRDIASAQSNLRNISSGGEGYLLSLFYLFAICNECYQLSI